MSPPSTPADAARGDPFTVAVVQHPPVFLNLGASVERALELIDRAVSGGARLIAFPETWIPGYPVWLDHARDAGLWDHPPAKALYRRLAEHSVEIPGPRGGALDRLRDGVAEAGCCVVMGLHERRGGTLYNTMAFLGPGPALRLHRKLIPTYTERLVWGRGDGSTLDVHPLGAGTVGGLVCWEHWMPLARAALHDRGETVHVAQWPWVKEMHRVASRHYAFEGRCFVLAAGSVLSREQVLDGWRSASGDRDDAGGELLEAIPDDAILRGGSAVVGPDGAFLAGPARDEATILYAEVDPGRITEERMTLDVDGHYSRPDVFRLVVDDRPAGGVVRLSERRHEGAGPGGSESELDRADGSGDGEPVVDGPDGPTERPPATAPEPEPPDSEV